MRVAAKARLMIIVLVIFIGGFRISSINTMGYGSGYR